MKGYQLKKQMGPGQQKKIKMEQQILDFKKKRLDEAIELASKKFGISVDKKSEILTPVSSIDFKKSLNRIIGSSLNSQKLEDSETS